MLSFSKGFLAHRLGDLRDRLRHAFTVRPAGEPLSPEDVAVLERVAEAIVARGMATPAMVFLESVGPLNFLGSQALHFFTPILEVVVPHREIERVAFLLERRDTLSRLTGLIERLEGCGKTSVRPEPVEGRTES